MPARAPYVMAIRAGDLFADPVYQRDAEPKRVRKMADDFDPRLLGVIDVSAREKGRYAILDGQHRHALVVAVHGVDTPIVCQVYEDLTVDEEARLFHEINVRRKALNFWDRWKSRRASGDQLVAEIEATLAGHGLRVHPTATDGNIGATAALERIVTVIGDSRLLDQVVDVLLRAFSSSRDAFQGPLLEGVAYVLANYPPDQLSRSRLAAQLAQVHVRQIRARAAGLREMHKGREPRLIAQVIVEQYNRGAGTYKVQPYIARVPNTDKPAATRARWLAQQDTSAGRDRPQPLADGQDHRDNDVDGASPHQDQLRPPAEAGPPCQRCGHDRADHMKLMPQCSAEHCTCLHYAAALAPAAS